jgi:replicative DNA helicase
MTLVTESHMATVPTSDRFPSQARGDAQIESLRLPPHSVEAEQSVLGGLLLSNPSWDRIGDVVAESDFYRHDHRVLWRVITKLIEDNKPADILTVAESLKLNGELDAVGGIAYLQQLANGTPSAANIRRYAEIVRERAIMRRLAEVGTAIAESAFTPTGRDAAKLLDEAETKILEIGESGGRTQKGLLKMTELLAEVMNRVDELHKNPSAVTGKATGFVDLDEMTSGLQEGDLVIVAGRPSMGKTSMALNIAEHVGLELKLPVLIFSMEMGGTQLGLRMLGSVAKVDAQRLRTGRLDPSDWDRLGTALGKLNEAPILVDETAALNPLELRSRARRLWREYGGLGLIVIDYIQLMSSATSGVENRATEISEISRSLKAMAKELQVPVVALSQLNRSLEQRPNKRPVMSDLRECVTGDTPVVLASGRRVPIRELVGMTPEVLSMSPDGAVIRAHSDCVWSKGVKPVFRVSLASGRSIRATAQHRLYGLEGWIRVEDLHPGSRLATVCDRGPPRWNESEVTLSVEARVDGLESAVQQRASMETLGSIKPLHRDTSHKELLRSALADYADKLDDPSLMRWVESDLFWDRVVAVDPAGEEEVFDLTVPGPSSWLADGIVSHNSGAIEQDADLILFIYRDEVYNDASEDKGLAEIIVGKQRNGPIGTVKLTFRGQHTRFENYAGPSSSGY